MCIKLMHAVQQSIANEIQSIMTIVHHLQWLWLTVCMLLLLDRLEQNIIETTCAQL